MLLKTIAGVSLVLACVLSLCLGWAIWMMPVAFVGLFLIGFGLAVLFLWIICARVDLTKPQEEDDRFYRSVMYVYIEALIQLVRVRLHTKGLENTPNMPMRAMRLRPR